MRGSILVVTALVACNQIYGLDPTTEREPAPDRDADTIPDELDNCPDIKNATQDDADADGVGDVCDGCQGCAPCDVGPQHDEDNDLVADGCDNCPTVKNALQQNADADDLGDACDANAMPQRRLLFDGFGAIDDSWARIGDWRVAGDSAETVEGPHPFDYRLTKVLPIILGQRVWTMEIVFELPAAPGQRDSMGGYLVKQTGETGWACTVIFENGKWGITNGVTTDITLSPGLTKMTLSSKRAGTPQLQYCTVGSAEKQNNTGENYPLGVEVWANRVTRFHYIEVIE